MQRRKADLPEIASDLQLEIDELFPVTETLQMLRLADIGDGDITLTENGKRFAIAEIDERKRMFAAPTDPLRAPSSPFVRRVLDERESHSAPWNRFIDELEDYMTTDTADETLRAVVSWARFAELFSHDDDTEMFCSLENPPDVISWRYSTSIKTRCHPRRARSEAEREGRGPRW